MVELPSNLNTMFNGRFGLTGRILNPVIVESQPNAFADVEAILRDMVPEKGLMPSFTGLPRVTRLAEFAFSSFKSIELFNMVGTVLTRDMVEEVAQMREVKKIYPDMIKWALQFPTVPTEGVFQNVKGAPFTSTWWTKKAIGADIANEQGFTGKDVTAVVIDSGARISHPQLRGVQALTAAREKGMSGADSNGHGSWCTACVGGSFATDRAQGAPVEGMAPDSKLISIQALGFVVGIGSSSDIIKAMEMTIELGADVVSMSLGSNDAPPDADNPEAVAIKKMIDADIIPVIAGGNAGPTSETIGSPGSVAEALTVGAHDPVSGELADFSSRGPTGGDGLIKPDVIATGVMIDSALVGLLDTMVDPQARQFGAISGTSMATPHVAGLLTNARQFFREELDMILTTDMVKEAMRLNAEAKGIIKDNQIGWGPITWDILTRFAESLKPPKKTVPEVIST